MSATHDKTQKVTFVYSNLYPLFKSTETKNAEPQAIAVPRAGLASGNVLKKEDLKQAQATVRDYAPAELVGKRVARPKSLPPSNHSAVESLKKNLTQLNELHSRLKFMLQELEDLVKE